MATIGLLPPSSWMGALVRATQANMSILQPQQGVHLIWAMYRTNHAPPRQYIDALLEQVTALDGLWFILNVKWFVIAFGCFWSPVLLLFAPVAPDRSMA